MGCGCGCEETTEEMHKHAHCGKPMTCKEDKYVCVECGFTEECDCAEEEKTEETKEETE